MVPVLCLLGDSLRYRWGSVDGERAPSVSLTTIPMP